MIRFLTHTDDPCSNPHGNSFMYTGSFNSLMVWQNVHRCGYGITLGKSSGPKVTWSIIQAIRWHLQHPRDYFAVGWNGERWLMCCVFHMLALWRDGWIPFASTAHRGYWTFNRKGKECTSEKYSLHFKSWSFFRRSWKSPRKCITFR